jgi:hypothetical protein
MVTKSTRLIGSGSLAGLGCYFRVSYSLEYFFVVAPGANPTRQTVWGKVQPPFGVSLPVGKVMSLTLQDGSNIRVVADERGQVTSVGPFKLTKVSLGLSHVK